MTTGSPGRARCPRTPNIAFCDRGPSRRIAPGSVDMPERAARCRLSLWRRIASCARSGLGPKERLDERSADPRTSSIGEAGQASLG
jgi:hypothetical protein